MATHTFDAQRNRPYAPDYGLEADQTGMLTWGWVSAQMQQARNYWVATTRPDGNPHAAPIWGLWHADVFYFGTGATSRKGKNMQRNPNVVIHLESGDETLIFEGVVSAVTDTALTKTVYAEYGVKYNMTSPEAQAELINSGTLYRLAPRRVLAWLENDYPRTATRWNF
ncbi:MAG: pyridoxamine 5'-phosphate oxidase [Chloroflexi bacterium]|nr:pyridoxamine 5'-phosphate oxidase [Chloroflexota bacterium]